MARQWTLFFLEFRGGAGANSRMPQWMLLESTLHLKEGLSPSCHVIVREMYFMVSLQVSHVVFYPLGVFWAILWLGLGIGRGSAASGSDPVAPHRVTVGTELPLVEKHRGTLGKPGMSTLGLLGQLHAVCEYRFFS